MVIKRIGVWSAAKLYAAISAAMGLLIGFFFAMASLIGAGMAGPNDEMPAWMAGAFGVGAIVILPIMYGVLGLIGGALGALFYNVFAALAGGLEVETE